jgi:hypothetical protein
VLLELLCRAKLLHDSIGRGLRNGSHNGIIRRQLKPIEFFLGSRRRLRTVVDDKSLAFAVERALDYDVEDVAVVFKAGSDRLRELLNLVLRI